MDTIFLKNARIFNGERFIKGNVLIKDGKIAAIGKVGIFNKNADKNAIILDCKNGVLTSGLVDIHTHFSEMGNDNFGFPGDLCCIPFGVTYGVDACAEPTNVALVDNLCVQSKVFVEIGAVGEEINVENAEKKLLIYGERAIGLKTYFDDNLGNGFSFEHLKKVCALAREKNLKVMVHSSNSPVSMEEIVDCLSKGDILTHCYHGGKHCIEENGYIAYKKAKAKGVVLDAGMAGGVHTDFALLKRAIKNGFTPDTISSDITKFSAFKRGGIYGLPTCLSIMKLLGLSEEKVFQSATISAAKAVEQEAWFGLEIGKEATMSLMKWKKTHICTFDGAGNKIKSRKGYVCQFTIKNGQILYRKS